MRAGDWFLTFTGKKFWPLDPRPEEVCIEDIAHALANVCRFGGHCKTFYSVAQHSDIVSCLVYAATEKCGQSFIGLMHDATEAYVGDMVRPLKLSMPDFKRAELVVWQAIAQKFEMPTTDPSDDKVIKHADNTALMTERRDVCVLSSHKWSLQDDYPPMLQRIEPVAPAVAERQFLERFHKLTGNAPKAKLATARSA